MDLPSDGEIIVVDGDPEHSAQPVVERVNDSRGTEIRYLACAPSSTHQRNVGMDAAQGEVVVFTDDDAVLLPGLFEEVVAAFADPSVVGATGRVIEPADERIGSDSYSRLRWLVLGGGPQGTMTSYGFRRPLIDTEIPRDMQYMPGTFMCARRSVGLQVRFDERLGGYALGEDDDFSYRLSRRGRVVYLPGAAVRHQALGTRTMDRRAQDRLVVINRTYLFHKNFDETPRARLGFARLIATLFLHRLVNREWQGVLGLIDGVRTVMRPHDRDRPAGRAP